MEQPAEIRPASPVAQSPTPVSGPPERQRSPIPFLMLMFVIPLIVMLAIAKFRIAERLAEWIGKLFE